jgi:hypothetical protein
MTWKRVFVVVTVSALTGMILGGLFGFAVGKITPEHVIPWQDVEPVGLVTFFGATAGVLLGGGPGCFAVIVQGIMHWRKTACLHRSVLLWREPVKQSRS